MLTVDFFIVGAINRYLIFLHRLILPITQLIKFTLTNSRNTSLLSFLIVVNISTAKVLRPRCQFTNFKTSNEVKWLNASGKL